MSLSPPETLRLRAAAVGDAYAWSLAEDVDAENPTGATRLYERAGMHVAYEAVTYEKELE